MPYYLTPSDLERFWSKITKTPICWLWISAKTAAGYGVITIGRRVLLAHRISWELHNGPIPNGMNVLHNCPGKDNPSCVNPEHLWLGTQRDNAADMVAKGQAGCVQHPERVLRGSKHGNAKLLESQVVELRELYASGSHRQGALASRFGISKSSVQKIISREHWAQI